MIIGIKRLIVCEHEKVDYGTRCRRDFDDSSDDDDFGSNLKAFKLLSLLNFSFLHMQFIECNENCYSEYVGSESDLGNCGIVNK